MKKTLNYCKYLGKRRKEVSMREEEVLREAKNVTQTEETH